MNTTDSLNIGCNIHLLSFSYDKYLIKHDVKVIVTTYPETTRQEFLVKSKDILFPNHPLSINISKNAKMIFIFFQKKCLLTKDPIIAWTVVQTSHFPQEPQQYDYNTSGTISGDIKMLEIYEYFQEGQRDKFSFTEKSVESYKNRNGQIEIQLTMTEPYCFFEDEHKHSKIPKMKNKDKGNHNHNHNHNYNNNNVNENNTNYDVHENKDEPFVQLKARTSDKKINRRSKCYDYITFE